MDDPRSDEPLRRCIWCDLLKPLSAFAFRSAALGTRQSHCRECHAAYRRSHYLRNRPEYIAREVDRTRRRRTENRRLMRAYLRVHPCVDCGESDIVTLQFDHRDRATKRQDVALLVVGKPWSAVSTEIEKCDVRCANCHRKRTASQLGWRRIDMPRTEVYPAPVMMAVLSLESGSRQCTGCGIAKPLEDFSYRDRSRGLRRARCRSCMRAYAREHYIRNKARYATADWERKRSSRRDLSREIDDYLRMHACADCGETNPVVLEFDHRDGVSKLETIAFLRVRGTREDLMTEIGKCDVRCSNCHQRRTAKQFGWTKLLVA
jgi:transcription elongation factor Elf1